MLEEIAIRELSAPHAIRRVQVLQFVRVDPAPANQERLGNQNCDDRRSDERPFPRRPMQFSRGLHPERPGATLNPRNSAGDPAPAA